MRLKTSEIKLNPDNPRTIKDEKYKKLVQSLKDFPEMADAREIIVNKDHVILGGNMRFKAMQEAGWKEIPVKIVDWSKEKQAEFVIKDNASFGEWDWDAVANQYELEDLEAWGVDLPEYLTEEDEVEEDEAPEVSKEKPKSKLGEIYQLGRHRLMCGSSTSSKDIKLLMNKKANMLMTDPPYNVDLGHIGNKYNSFNDKQKPQDYRDMLETSMQNAFATTTEDSPWYIFSANRDLLLIKEILEGLDLRFHQWLMWVKRGGIWGNSDYIQNYEIVTYGYKGKHQYFGSKGQEAAIIQERENNINSIGHPTSKPIAVLEPMIRGGSKKDDIVLDLFGGSGSTLIACEQLDRTCYMMELDPKYCDVIRKRYAKFVNNNELPDNWEELTKAVK